jgi:hypothetical protein
MGLSFKIVLVEGNGDELVAAWVVKPEGVHCVPLT